MLEISLLGGAISEGALAMALSGVGLFEGIEYLCVQAKKFEVEYVAGKRGWF